MEQREALDAEHRGVRRRDRRARRRQSTGCAATIAAAEAEIDAEIADEEAARAELAQRSAESLLADYERRRAQNKGAGAARWSAPPARRAT